MGDLAPPSGCAHCGTPQAGHGRQRYTPQAGWHGWSAPSDGQIKERMLARRALKDRALTAPARGPGARGRYLEALARKRAPHPYEQQIISEIRERDTNAGATWRELNLHTADRRILLGLHDESMGELLTALEENDMLSESVRNLTGACRALVLCAKACEKGEAQRAAGLRQAAAIVLAALHTHTEEDGTRP